MTNTQYRYVNGYDCGNGIRKIPSYFTEKQVEEINEFAALSGCNFSAAVSKLVNLGLKSQPQTVTDRRRVALLCGWGSDAEKWNIRALDHLLEIKAVFGEPKMLEHARLIKEKAKTV